MQRRAARSKSLRVLSLLVIALFAVTLMAACGGAAGPESEAEPAAPAEAEAPAAEAEAAVEVDPDALEAPELAEMVAAGELPPVEERLPTEPLVVEGNEGLGEYGGTWHTALVGGQDTAWLRRTISYDYLTRWDTEWTKVLPNVAKSVDANEDASEYTFHLREGMKWSDGEPFTAHDVLFWWEGIESDPDVHPVGPPSWMKSGDEWADVELVDDYTFIVKFPQPNGLFLQHLATPNGWLPTRYPKHYCEQFHANYNEENLDELVAAEGANDWVNLIQTKCAGVEGEAVPPVFRNADMPTLYPWKFTTAYGEGTQVVAERNPYYWKVDSAGRQLPYIDRVVFDILEDKEVLLLKVLNGEVDMMSRHFNTNDNKAVLSDNMAAGEFGFFETRGGGNTLGLHFNLTHKDDRMREIFQNKDFRIAVSHCIDRQEIIDLIFIGQGEPMGNAMDRTSIPDLFDEEMYTQYTEHDPDLAHEHLAAAGMTEKDDNGFFLGPDGEPFNFVIQATDSFGHSDRAEIITQHLQNCGLNAQLKVMDRSLLYTLKDANEHDVHVWGAGGSSSVFLDPRHFFPYSQESAFAQAWVTWYENPTGDGALTQPEEPPEIVQHQMELYEQIKATGDQELQLEWMKEIIEIAKDQFYVVGISSSPPGFGIVKNNFKNVPESMPGSWQYPTPAPTNPEQYWIQQ